MSHLKKLIGKKNQKVLQILPDESITDIYRNFKIDAADSIQSSELINQLRQKKYHNNFDTILMLDFTISDYEYWELFLDEILRFLKKNSRLIIHARGGKYASVWGIKSFISDKINISSNLISQEIISLNESIIELKLNRKIYKSKNWTIGIPSNGKKNKIILDLMKSVFVSKENLKEKNGIDIKVEFLLVGQKDSIFNDYKVRYFNQNIDSNLPALGEKKNIIINNAKYENILLIHDRYKLDKSFFSGFEEWGYDFDYCSVNQFDSNGEQYDPILMLENFNRSNMQMFRLNGDFNHQNLYVNGGLIVVKKIIAQKVNFNSILFQNEAEDIDFARKLHALGIVARFNNYSQAVTSITIAESNLKKVPNYVKSIDTSK